MNVEPVAKSLPISAASEDWDFERSAMPNAAWAKDMLGSTPNRAAQGEDTHSMEG